MSLEMALRTPILGAVFQWGCVAPRTLPWIPVTIIYFNIQHISTLSSNITAVILQIIFLCVGHMAGNAQLKRARVVRTILLGCLTDWYDSNSIQSWNHGCVGFTYAIDVCVEKIGCSRVWMFQPTACMQLPIMACWFLGPLHRRCWIWRILARSNFHSWICVLWPAYICVTCERSVKIC